MTKKEMIESFANNENQKKLFYNGYKFKKIRKRYVKMLYNEYHKCLNSDNKISRCYVIRAFKSMTNDPYYCVKC